MNKFTPNPSVPPVVVWPNGHVNFDGKDFGPTRDEEGVTTAEENAVDWALGHYDGVVVDQAFENALDLTPKENSNKKGKR